MQKYTAEYFISKFERIPSKRFAVGEFEKHGRMCALGHCGQRVNRESKEAQALSNLFANHGLEVVAVNDAFTADKTTVRTLRLSDTTAAPVTDLGKSAKERILNALTLIATGLLKKTE